MKRVLIIGCCGAGKSTLAKKLGEITGLPVVHLDYHFWRPGWVQTPDDEWPAVIDGLLKGENWIMDGNFAGSLAVRLEGADTVIYLDFKRYICVWRCLKRFLLWRGTQRPDLGPGCPEKMDWKFLLWVWNFRRDIKPEVEKILSQSSVHATVITLRSDREVLEFSKRVKAEQIHP